MASKAFIFLVFSSLLAASTVSSNEETFLEAAYAKTPAKAPVAAPVPAPAPVPVVLVKPPVKAPVKPPVVPVKPPVLPIKPPVTAPPPPYVPKPVLPPVQDSACPGLCAIRCTKSSRPNQCNRICGTCCYRCKCVPPGYYGNREECGPCYNKMKTRQGKLKCP